MNTAQIMQQSPVQEFTTEDRLDMANEKIFKLQQRLNEFERVAQSNYTAMWRMNAELLKKVEELEKNIVGKNHD